MGKMALIGRHRRRPRAADPHGDTDARPHRQSRRLVAGRTVGELSCLEHEFDIREFGQMSTPLADDLNAVGDGLRHGTGYRPCPRRNRVPMRPLRDATVSLAAGRGPMLDRGAPAHRHQPGLAGALAGLVHRFTIWQVSQIPDTGLNEVRTGMEESVDPSN
jgi:hypothetical protein